MECYISTGANDPDMNATWDKLERQRSDEKRATVAKIMQAVAEVVPMFDSVVTKMYSIHDQITDAEDDYEILDQVHRNLVKIMKERLDTTYSV
jgi:hypothetical protein